MPKPFKTLQDRMSAEHKRRADERFEELRAEVERAPSVDETWRLAIKHYDWLLRRLAEGG